MGIIVTNNTPFDFSALDLPCLIHGKPKEGASLFTMCLAAQLCKQGEKLLVLCGYPQAKAEFIRQMGTDSLSQSRATFFTKENFAGFVEYTALHSNTHDRILLIKNFELFSAQILRQTQKFRGVLLSGNLDECGYGTAIEASWYSTQIYFSKPLANRKLSFQNPPKYSGVVIRKTERQIVRVKE